MSRFPVAKHPIMYLENRWHRYKYKYGKSPDGTVEKKLYGLRFIFDPSLGSHTKKQYHGTYELKVVQAMRKNLSPGAVFLDIGANIGYLSAIGAGLVGEKGSVHSFEPVPAYFERLLYMTKLNPNYNILVNNFALGESEASMAIDILRKPQIGGSSMVPDFVHKTNIEKTINVRVKRLDSYISQNNLSEIGLIKIDAEGYELPVLRGSSRFFEKSKNRLPPIIVEVAPSAYKLLGSSLHELEDFMLSHGYRAYCIFGRHRVDIKRIERSIDVLFKSEAL